MKKEILLVLLLLIFTIPAIRSLLIPGAFTSHDLTHHIIRQINMDRLLSEGQFPPRWSGDLASGYGYPLFIFNYPLPALVGEIFHKVGLNFVDSVKAVLFASLVLSTLSMYLFLRSLLKSKIPAFLGAIFYLYAPIHLIVVYVSGATGASFALIFPPLIFWAIHKIWEGRKLQTYLLLGSLSFAGLILSHNITALIFMPVILAYVAALKFLDPKKEHFLRNIGLIFLWGLGLSAFFWLPALMEKQYIRYDNLTKGIYQDQFPSLNQIIYSPWGYGLSHPKQPEGGMSYQVGLVHILVMLLLLPSMWFYRKRKEFIILGTLCLISFIASIFFMLETSQPLWDKLPFLSYIQFPVRILIVPIFCSSIAAAMLVKYLPYRKIIFGLLLILVLYANRNNLGINQSFNPPAEYYQALSHKTTTTSFDEDLPVWVSKMQTDIDHPKFIFLSGGGKINVLESKSAKVLANIESTSSAQIRFNQYYFPGWEIKVDNKKINFNCKNTGLPSFNIEKGSHKVLAEFKNTPDRNIADSISLFSIVILLILLCRLSLGPLFLIKKYY